MPRQLVSQWTEKQALADVKRALDDVRDHLRDLQARSVMRPYGLWWMRLANPPRAGIADIIGCLGGRMVAVEVKSGPVLVAALKRIATKERMAGHATGCAINHLYAKVDQIGCQPSALLKIRPDVLENVLRTAPLLSVTAFREALRPAQVMEAEEMRDTGGLVVVACCGAQVIEAFRVAAGPLFELFDKPLAKARARYGRLSDEV